MARNSFALKGFAVVVVSLAALDASNLALERAYRRLYNEAVAGPESEWGLSAGMEGSSFFALYGFGVATAVVVLVAA